jgi:hypothetical protein
MLDKLELGLKPIKASAVDENLFQEFEEDAPNPRG